MSLFSKWKRWVFLGGGMATYGALVYFGDPLLLFLLAYAGFSLVALGVAVVLILCVVVGLCQHGIGVPGVGILDVLRLVARRSIPSVNRTLFPLAAIGVFAGLLVISLPINKAIRRWAEAEAKAYPDLVATLLEQYRQQHGTYPYSLEELPSRPSVPRLLRGKNGYRSVGVHDGAYYSFSFATPVSTFGFWEYSSRTRKWNFSD